MLSSSFSSVRILFPETLDLRRHHLFDHLPEAHGRLPIELPPRLRRICQSLPGLQRACQCRVARDARAPVLPYAGISRLAQLVQGVQFPDADDEIVGSRALQHEPHRTDEVAGVAPIPGDLEVAQDELAVLDDRL